MFRTLTRTWGATLGLLALMPSAALAHTGVGPTHGFVHGFVHPLLGFDHLLAMVAVGLWAAQRGGRAVWALPAAFVGAMIVGGAIGVSGLQIPAVEAGILASVLLLGAAIAIAASPALPLATGVVAIFALFHGHAHGTEMPVAVSGLFYGAGFAAATALLHAAGVALVLSVRHLLGTERQAWLRFAGAAIACAGVVLWVA